MSLNNDNKRGNSGGGGAGAGLSDLHTGSDPNGLVAGLMGLQQQQSGNGGLQTQDGNDTNASSALMGGMSAGMMGGQIGLDGQHDPNTFLAQQQALMAMAAGAGTGVSTGLENGSNKDALMNLLAKQGLGGPMGGMNLGPAPIGMGNAMGNIMGGVGGIGGFQSNPLGGIGSIGGLGRTANGNCVDNTIGAGPIDNTGSLLANPVLSGFPTGLQGGFQGGLPMGMGGMAGIGMPGMAGMAGMAGLGGVGLMGSALGGNLTGVQTAGQGVNINDRDNEGNGIGGITADATTSGSANPMIQQNLLMQQLLAQQQATLGGVTGSLWQQYGNLPGAEGLLSTAGANGAQANNYFNMLGQGGANNTVAPEATASQREPGESGVFRSGSIPEFAKSGKKARPKKPKNKPKRPLSAYNIFFRDERANILAGIPDKDEDDDDVDDDENDDGLDAKKKSSGKKRKRPPHGKIGFESLAKIVGQRWKELKPEELAKYKKLADVDMVRYRAEMESYVAKQREGLEQSREHLDNLVDNDNKGHFFGEN